MVPLVPLKKILRITPYVFCFVFLFCYLCKEKYGYGKHKKIALYKNLCIQPGKNNLVIYGDVPYKSLAIYSHINIRVPVGNHTATKTWDLEIRHNEDIPKSSIFMNKTAYFVKLSFAANIHHFWHDTFKGLFGAIKKLNELNVEKHVYYNRSIASMHKKCRNKFHGPMDCLDDHYKTFIYRLNVSSYKAYQEVNTLTCYKRAVFGYTIDKVKKGKLEKYVKTRFGVSHKKCPTNLILIQQRKYRRITNANKLQKAISKAGFQNVTVVDFEDMPIPEQMKLASCTKILIGIHGAGLEWFRFMHKPAGLIEIGWNHWPPERYGLMAKDEGYDTLQIFDCPAKLSDISMHAYAKNNNGKYISISDERAVDELSKESLENPKYLPSNVWKYADCDVPIERIVVSVKQMITKYTDLRT